MRRTLALAVSTMLLVAPKVFGAEKARRPASAATKPSVQQKGSGFSLFIREAKAFAAAQDDLGLRVLYRRYLPGRMTAAQWSEARALLHARPGVGWDLLRAWDSTRSRIKGTKNPTSFTKVEQDADTAMSAGDFMGAAKNYERILRALGGPTPRFKDANFFLYHSVLHSYARALYGANRAKEAMDVYGWISPLYPQFRQVQFEKMWAASRAGLFGHALGAIASQRSSFFSKWLEPETYLVQYYLFKRLCRDDEVARVRAEAAAFQKAIESGSFGYAEWARRDVETLLLIRLKQSPSEPRSSSVVNGRARSEEITWITKLLEERFQKDLPRIKQQMENVVAYFNLAIEATKQDLPAALVIPGLTQVLESDREMWPVSDAEDWLDEQGNHVFVGQSECQGKVGNQ